MKIAIIGAGNVGSALGASAVKAGHTVSISASKPESAERAAGESGARAARTNREAVEGWARPRLATIDHEELWMLALDGRHGLRAARRIARALPSGSAMPRRRVRRARWSGCTPRASARRPRSSRWSSGCGASGPSWRFSSPPGR